MEEMNMEIHDKEKREEHVTYMKKRAEEGSCQLSHYSPTIYKVPLTLRQCDKAAYEPRIISIGPYHCCRCGKKWFRAGKRLRAMESHKWRYLHDFLTRNRCHSLDDYFKKVEELEVQARGCYSEKILLNRLEFTEVMVLDGCFVIELFLKLWKGDAAKDDPVYNHPWVMNSVVEDLVLFENQLPFFILDSLYGVLQISREFPPLVQISLSFFSLMGWNWSTGKDGQESESVLHLLHLVHSHLFSPLTLPPPPPPPPPPPTSSTSTTTRFIRNIWVCCLKLVHYMMQKLKNLLLFFQKYSYLSFQRISCFCFRLFRSRKAKLLPTHIRSWPIFSTEIIPSATRLKDSGVNFSAQKVPKSPLDITFNISSGKMEIPYLCVDDGTNSLFRNLAAFEQCVPSAGVEFTSYVSFMDDIVNTAKDVEILRSHGIIENMLGSDEEVALLFNRMCTGIMIGNEDTQISRVIKDAKAYSETKRHVRRATLMRDYFGSPWSFISVMAAAFVILLTLIQTILAFLSYFRGSS